MPSKHSIIFTQLLFLIILFTIVVYTNARLSPILSSPFLYIPFIGNLIWSRIKIKINSYYSAVLSSFSDSLNYYFNFYSFNPAEKKKMNPWQINQLWKITPVTKLTPQFTFHIKDQERKQTTQRINLSKVLLMKNPLTRCILHTHNIHP